MNPGDGSPFYHCHLCTKAYSSEKSLYKHMRKKHGLSRDQLNRSQPNLKPSSVDAESLAQSPTKQASSQQHRQRAKPFHLEEEGAIVCPECNGTIKSKKGVAKHYMCFHNVVYSAWKTGWFGRNIRLMDLTKAMITNFYTSDGSRPEQHEPAVIDKAGETSGGEVLVVCASEDEEDKETDEAVEPEAVQLVEDEIDDVGEEDQVLVLDDAEDALPEAAPATKSLGEVADTAWHPVAAVRISRRRRSRLKTILATTSPFSVGKNGRLEFNNNEDPLDINCPFCIVHKTTIKGLAKHCVNHHPTDYANWKDGAFGSVQLRYIRPDSATLSQAISCFKSKEDSPKQPKQQLPGEKSLTIIKTPEQQAHSQQQKQQRPHQKKEELKPKQKSDQILPASVSGLNLIKLVPCPICHKMVRGHTLSGHCATQHPGELNDNQQPMPSSSAEEVESSGGIKRKSEISIVSGLFEDDRQATPCPFCGELIFSKGMGKHCIYFHNDQYQEWKAGKYGNVPLRFVPSQISGVADVEAGAFSDHSDRTSSKQPVIQQKSLMTIAFPGDQASVDSCGSEVSSVMPAPASGNSITLRIKPSFQHPNASSSQSQSHSAIRFDSKLAVEAVERSGLLGRAAIDLVAQDDSNESENQEGALLMDCDDDELDNEEGAFTCHYCDATFDSSDSLKEHFAQKHIEDGAKATFGDYQKPQDQQSGGRYQTAGRFICDICHTPYPSKRSLSQHYRIHKFDRVSSGASVHNFASDDAHLEADRRTENREPGELRSAEKHSESKNVDSGLGKGFGVADVVDVAAMPTADAKTMAPPSADCPKCCKAFSDKWYLLDHMTRCFAQQLSSGKLDSKDLAALAGVEDDADTRNSSPPIEKSHLDFESQKIINENMEEVYKCQFCDRTFKTSSHTRNHEQFCSSDSVTRVAYACDVCGKRFYLKCHLAVHMKVHKATIDANCDAAPTNPETAEKSEAATSFECKQCGKTFSSSANLLKHRVVHTNSSVHCKTCNREFKMACHLARHFCSAAQSGSPQPDSVEQSDNEERGSDGSYECDLCHRTFQYAGNLAVHKRFCQQHGLEASAAPAAILLDADDEGFECGMCNETFRDKFSLEIHTQACRLTEWKPAVVLSAASVVDSATGRSQFECRRCPEKFCSRSELLVHLRGHGYSNCEPQPVKSAPPMQPPPAKKPRLDPASTAGGCPLQLQCDLCASQFSSSLGLVVHKSKCHPDFYGPSHRRAQQLQMQQEKAQQQMQIKNRLIAKILMMPDQPKMENLTALNSQPQLKVATKITPSAAAQLVITKSGPSDPPSQLPPGPPLLSLPNRCEHCPRAFLTLSKLNEHLANVHGQRIAEGVQVERRASNGSTPNVHSLSLGNLVLDCGLRTADNKESKNANIGDDCDARFEDFGVHSQYPEADAYLCTECDRSFSTLELLTRHQKLAHQADLGNGNQRKRDFLSVPLQSRITMTALVAPPPPPPSGARKRKSVPMATASSTGFSK